MNLGWLVLVVGHRRAFIIEPVRVKLFSLYCARSQVDARFVESLPQPENGRASHAAKLLAFPAAKQRKPAQAPGMGGTLVKGIAV